MSNSEYKYQQLKDTILAAIRSGELPPGAKIEPELELMRQHQLSRNTVRQALIELESDGVLYRARRLGTFVRRQPPARIAFLMPDAAYATYPLNSDIIRGMDAVLTPANYALNVMVGALRYEPDTVSRLADDCSGVLISTNEPDPELLTELTRLKRPFRLVKNYTPGFETSAIRFDFHQAGVTAVRSLVARGITRLALFGLNPARHCIGAEFLRGVVDTCAEFGVALPGANRIDAYGKSASELAALFKGLPVTPEAIVCGTDEIALQMQKLTGLPVIGCNDLPEAKYCHLTTIRLDGVELGKRAATAILSELAGAPVNYPPLPGELIER